MKAANNVDVMFVSSTPYTWSSHVRYWLGGFMQIDEEIMTHPILEDFRVDFGLDDPELSKNPTIMQILGILINQIV